MQNHTDDQGNDDVMNRIIVNNMETRKRSHLNTEIPVGDMTIVDVNYDAQEELQKNKSSNFILSENSNNYIHCSFCKILVSIDSKLSHLRS